MQIIVWIVLCLVVALLGKDRKIGYGWSLFFCVFLSPLVGLVIILCSKKIKQNTEFEDMNKEGGVQ